MTNYYSELKLDPSAPLLELQDELLRQEQLWRRREVNSPDRAAEKLVLINEAKKVFASPSSKAAYDRELENSQRKQIEVNPKEERYLQYKRWYDQAIKYMKSRQYDLAKSSIEKAIYYSDPESINPWFYNDTSIIYRETGDYASALLYINKAIILDDSIAELFITKGLVYSAKVSDVRVMYDEREKSRSQEYEIYKTAISKARNSNDKRTLGIAYSMLAYCCSRGFENHENELGKQQQTEMEKQAELYSSRANELGDPWGIGKQVYTIISRIKQYRKEIAEETKKKEQEFQSWQNQDIFDSIEDAVEAEKNRAVEKQSIEQKKREARENLDFSEDIEREAQHLFAVVRSRLAEDLAKGQTGGIMPLRIEKQEKMDSWAYNVKQPDHHILGSLGIPVSKHNQSYRNYVDIFHKIPDNIFFGNSDPDILSSAYGERNGMYLTILKIESSKCIFTKYGKQLMVLFEKLCKDNSVNFEILAHLDNWDMTTAKKQPVKDIRIGETFYIKYPRYVTYNIHYKASSELAEYAKGKRITLKETSNLSTTIDHSQKRLRRDNKKKSLDSGYIWIIIIIAIIVVFEYLALHFSSKAEATEPGSLWRKAHLGETIIRGITQTTS